MKELTIMITTYNRKKNLHKMLNSVMVQGQFEKYKLLIVDNHSDDYDWDEILQDYPREFRDIIRIERRSFNCGMTCNISSCFLFVDTKWVLFLSDDDEMIEGSLDTVFNDICRYSEYGVVHYTISNMKQHEDRDISSIQEYIDYYKTYPFKGDIIYLTQLYNMDVLRPYLGLLTTYAYSYVSFNLPMYFGLIDKKFSIRLSSSSLVNYIVARAGDSWSRLPVALGMCSFMDIPFNLSYKEKQTIFRLFTADFTVYRMMRSLVREKCDMGTKFFFFRKIRNHFYKPYHSKDCFIFSILFYCYRLFRLDVLHIYDSMKK